MAEPHHAFRGDQPDRLITADQRRLLDLFGRLNRKERAAVLSLLTALAGQPS